MYTVFFFFFLLWSDEVGERPYKSNRYIILYDHFISKERDHGGDDEIEWHATSIRLYCIVIDN